MSECNDTCKYYKHCWSRGEGLKEDGEKCVYYEPDRPSGEWIKERLQFDERHFRSFAKCKVCGCEFKPYSFAVKEFDFCPKCGADMRREGDEK